MNIGQVTLRRQMFRLQLRTYRSSHWVSIEAMPGLIAVTVWRRRFEFRILDK